MRVGLISLLGLVVFIAVSLWVQHYIETNTKQLDQQLKQAETNLNSKRWGQALTDLKTVKKSWRKIKPTWSLLLHHQEIDYIEQALVRTSNAIISKSGSDARIELGSLQHFLNHIPEREKLNLVNIF